MEYVVNFVVTLLLVLMEAILDALIVPIVRLGRWAIGKLFPNSYADRLLMSVETRILRWVHVRWIHEAHALRIVNTFRFIDDHIHELMDPFDAFLDPDKGLTIEANNNRIQREVAEYGESVPKDTLDRFTKKNPLSTKAGKYNKHALVFWLQESQRTWDRMLDD